MFEYCLLPLYIYQNQQSIFLEKKNSSLEGFLPFENYKYSNVIENKINFKNSVVFTSFLKWILFSSNLPLIRFQKSANVYFIKIQGLQQIFLLFLLFETLQEYSYLLLFSFLFKKYKIAYFVFKKFIQHNIQLFLQPLQMLYQKMFILFCKNFKKIFLKFLQMQINKKI